MIRTASLVVACAISTMLYGTQPGDCATFAAMLLLLFAVAIAAGYLISGVPRA